MPLLQLETVARLHGQLDAWLERRLGETGRAEDPLRVQGTCATQIGTPIEGETIGAGATPLLKRKQGRAAGIPAPGELNAARPVANEAPDEAKGVALHGYVKQNG